MRVVAVAPGSTEGDARGRDRDVGHAGAGRFSRRDRAALCGATIPRHDGGARGDRAGSKVCFALGKTLPALPSVGLIGSDRGGALGHRRR